MLASVVVLRLFLLCVLIHIKVYFVFKLIDNIFKEGLKYSRISAISWELWSLSLTPDVV